MVRITSWSARGTSGTSASSSASVRPVIGHQWVDRTTTERLEALFKDMADNKYATSTIDRTWNYLNQACQHAQRARRIKTNPAADVLLPNIGSVEELHASVDRLWHERLVPFEAGLRGGRPSRRPEVLALVGPVRPRASAASRPRCC